MLLGRQQEGVVWLPALLDLDLDVGIGLADAAEHALPIGALAPYEERQEPAVAAEQPLDHGAGDVLEALAAGDGLTAGEPEPVALSRGELVQLDVARRGRHLAGRDSLDGGV